MTVVVLLVGTFFYFIDSDSSKGNVVDNQNMELDVSQKQIILNDNSNNIGSNSQYSLSGIQEFNIFIKTNPEGIQKLFYYYSVGESINIPLSEGNTGEYQIHSIGGQKYYPLILGYEEAKLMRQEGLFSNIGDIIKNFFGKNVVVIGVMQRTSGALDMAHIVPLTRGELN